MKLTLTQTRLAAAIAKSQSVVEKRNTIPILGNVHLEAKGDRLKFRATDLDIEVTNEADAAIDQEGSITVPAGMFADIVKKLTKGAIVLLEVIDHHLHITAGRSKFSLPTLPVEDFPLMANSEYSNTFTIAASDLMRLFNKTRFAISTEETRYYLNGVYTHVVDGSLRGVATDGHRLAMVDVTAPDGAEGMTGIIIPRKTVGELIKLLDGDADVHVSASETKVRFEIGGDVITSKVIDGSYPEYTRVIPKSNDKRLAVDAADFIKAVDRVSTVSAERSRAVKMSISSDSVVLAVRSPERGDGEEDLSATFDGDPMDVGFNAKYLLEVIGQVDSTEAVFMLGTAGYPAMIEDDGAVFVLMPMRI